MKHKAIISLFTIFVLVFTLTVSVKSNDKPVIHVETANFSDETSGWGHCYIYGWLDQLPDAEKTHEVTILVYKDDGTIDSEDIAYIDQITTSNNNTFLFEFSLKDSLVIMDSTLKCKIGSNTEADVWSQDFTIPFNSDCHLINLANNTVFYGCDAYSLSSNNLTTDNVARSVISGGNKIYYKLGNKWYDLLNERATSNEYLMNTDNACSTGKVQQLIIEGVSKYYYYNEYVANLLK